MTWFKDLSILTVLISVLFGIMLGCYPLASPDSARYAEISREMVVAHDYLTPHLNNVKYFEKPPLFYWMQAAAIKTFGTSELAVSLVNALMALLCCLVVYYAARRLYDRLSGLLAAMLLATSSVFFALTRVITLDMTFTLFLTASCASFLLGNHEIIKIRQNCYRWAMYVFAGLALMTKGLIGVIFPAAIIFIWVLCFNKWRNLKNYCILSGVIILALIAVPWHILVQLKNPEFARFYFIEQHFLRYLTDYAGRGEAWWFFPAVIILGIYPWTCFMVQALKYQITRLIKQYRQQQHTMFFILWAVIIYVFYSFSNSKLIPYLLPVFPPLAILIGNYLASNFQNSKRWEMKLGFNMFFVINLIGGIAAGIYVFNADTLAFTKTSLYILALLLVVSGIITNFIYRRLGLRQGLFTLILTFMLVLIGLNPIITVANNHALKPLIITLQHKLSPQDEVVSYNNYYQDLPFYLQRQITVVNSFGELSFGVAHQDVKDWMIDTKTFLNRWSSSKRMFMIADIGDFESLIKETKITFYPMAKYLDKILVSNQELK